MANFFNSNRPLARIFGHTEGTVNYITPADTRTADERAELAREIASLQLPAGVIGLFDDFVLDGNGELARDAEGRLILARLDVDQGRLVNNPAVQFTAFSGPYLRRDLERLNARVVGLNNITMRELGHALRLLQSHEIGLADPADLEEYPDLFEGATRVFAAVNRANQRFTFIRFDGPYTTAYTETEGANRDITGRLYSTGTRLRLNRTGDRIADKITRYNEWLTANGFTTVNPENVISKWEAAAYMQQGFSLVVPVFSLDQAEGGQWVKVPFAEMARRIREGRGETMSKLQQIARGYQGQVAQEQGLRRADFLAAGEL